MQQFQLEPGRPIYCLQEFLRVIAQVNNTFPMLVPDGIYGRQTEAVVSQFQQQQQLPVTGEVDNDTWDRVIGEYSRAVVYTLPPPVTTLFPTSGHVIRAGDRADFHYSIQSVIYALANKFDNIGEFNISSLHAGKVIDTTKQLQDIIGSECNGEIDVECWKHISRMYENIISKNLFSMDTLRERISNPNSGNGQINSARPRPEMVRENYVGMEELENDIMLEQNAGRASEPNRVGIVSPRLGAYNIRSDEADESPLPSEVSEDSDINMSLMREQNIGDIQPNNMRMQNDINISDSAQQQNNISMPDSMRMQNNMAQYQDGIRMPQNTQNLNNMRIPSNRNMQNGSVQPPMPVQDNMRMQNNTGMESQEDTMNNNTDMENKAVPQKAEESNRTAEGVQMPVGKVKKEPLKWNFY